MKPTRLTLFGLCLTILFGMHALKVCAGPAPKIATNAPSAAKAAPQEPVIPRSIFEAPKTSQEGRDPFFPNSPRVFGPVVAKTNAGPAAVRLSLKALSGSPNNRLATINNVTFAAGEESDVVASAGRVRVRVIEIKEDSVIIEVGGARQTLRMRSGF